MSASVPNAVRRSDKGSAIMDRIRELQSRIEAAKTLRQHEAEQYKLELNKLRDELDRVRKENRKYQNGGSTVQQLQPVSIMPKSDSNWKSSRVDERQFNIILLVLNIGIVVTYFLKWIDLSLEKLSLLKILEYIGKLVEMISTSDSALPWQIVAILFLLLVMAGTFIYHIAAIGQQVLYSKCTYYKFANLLNLVCTLIFIVIVKYGASKINGLLFNLTSMGITAVPIVNAILSIVSLVILYNDKVTGADFM